MVILASCPAAPRAVRRRLRAGALLLSLVGGGAFTGLAQASGVLPKTSVVILEEADGETRMNVQNTDAHPVLLYTSILNLSEDDEPLVVAVPPVTRVEANETQLVRFILQSRKPLQVERLKRVTFEGIPPKAADGSSRISMNVRQNLPLLIRPKSLAPNREPWKLLKWSASGGQLHVRNDSPYVVRLGQGVQLLPGTQVADLGKTYLLPGSHLSVALPEGAARPSAVRLSPATTYGYAVESYDAPLAAGAGS